MFDHFGFIVRDLAVMRAALMSLAALAVSGCGERDETPPPSAANLAAPNPPTVQAPSTTPPGQPVAADTATPQGQLPPAASPTRYVGQWAAQSLGCAEPAWRFEADRLVTKGEVSCRFLSVQRSPAGYDIVARCTAEGPETPYALRLRFAESAGAMFVEGGPFGDSIGLTYCGPLTPASPG